MLQDAECMTLRGHHVYQQLIFIDPESSRQAMQFITYDSREFRRKKGLPI